MGLDDSVMCPTRSPQFWQVNPAIHRWLSQILRTYFTEVYAALRMWYGRGYYIFLCNTGYSSEKVERYIFSFWETGRTGLFCWCLYRGRMPD
jgi:hypothetical protein